MSKGTGKVGLFSPEAIGAFSLPQKWGIMPRTAARHCGKHSPGHTPHHIQGIRSVEKKWVKTKVEYLGSNIFRLTLEDGQVLTRFNHEPGRLLEHLSWFGESAVQFQSDFYLLGIETGSGRAMFSLSKVPLESCKPIVTN